VIGERAMVSLPPKSPHMARWQRLLKDFRGSNHEPYTPYAGQMVTTLDNPVPKGNSFRSLVRILDKSITADDPPRGGFSPLRAVKTFLTWAARVVSNFAGNVLNMKFQHVIFAATVLHSLHHLTASWRHKTLVAKLKLAFYAAITRLLRSSPPTSVAVRTQMMLGV